MSAWNPREFLSRTRGRIVIPPIRVTGFTVALLFALAIIFMFTSVQVTSQPRFCGSCHIMKPYYESWRHSSHHNIACVECHIAPGVGAEIRKKYEALSMVVSYFTGTYGTNPWTEVEDAACLRCHERRLLAGKEVIRDVLFDHSTHLSEMRRGKTLRCTSCHSQIVQGSHIAVTTSTCILCHFKNAKEGEGTTRCQLCHTVPSKSYTIGTIRFDHADVSRFGMECRWCHARPTGSQGEVPVERCVTCHNQPARLAKYSDTDLLHQMHVTKHKVDCMDCHLHLEHVAPITAKTFAGMMQLANTRIHQAATDCNACHQTGHSPQLALYTGTGGRGVPAMPSPMYVAGVRCEGCHQQLPGQTSEVNRASDISCMTCHGPEYRKIFQSWVEGTTRRAAAVRAEVASTQAAVGSGSPQLAEARFNLDIVERGHGVHNVSYAYALLRRSHDDLNAARRAKGLAPMAAPWREAPYESPCLSCHAGIEDQTGTIFGHPYAHEPHVIGAKLQCQACHRSHQEKPAGEVVRYGAEGCVTCHHRPPVQNCTTCHTDVKARVVKSFRGDFDHKLHIEDAGKTCTDCHEVSGPTPTLKKTACAECHE
ncbi:MAG: cytochrome c3 family protein [Bacteroidota bacterium]